MSLVYSMGLIVVSNPINGSGVPRPPVIREAEDSLPKVGVLSPVGATHQDQFG